MTDLPQAAVRPCREINASVLLGVDFTNVQPCSENPESCLAGNVCERPDITIPDTRRSSSNHGSTAKALLEIPTSRVNQFQGTKPVTPTFGQEAIFLKLCFSTARNARTRLSVVLLSFSYRRVELTVVDFKQS